ncbi:MAG: diacylglycerol kinase family protein [Deltaproteobacteria bacterium]|nr:diacylglycerol kinase family protein [Deltaproteobacteria bacterium]
MKDSAGISVIINPKSGNGEGVSLSEKIHAAFAATPGLRDNILFVEYTSETGDCNNIQKIVEGSKVVLICGGDGTIHQVVNLLKRYSYDRSISIFPVGTGNDLYRNIGSKEKDVVGLLNKLIVSPEGRKLDIFSINGKIYFTNYVSFGYDAYVISAYVALVNRLKGYRVFRLALLKKMLFVLVGFYSVAFYNRRISEGGSQASYINVIVNNLRTYAGGSIFDSNSSLDDGKIELSFVSSKMEYMKLILNRFKFFDSRLSNRSAEPPLVLRFQSSVPVQIDGEDYSSFFRECTEFRILRDSVMSVLV